MGYTVFSETPADWRVAILIKSTTLSQQKIQDYYIRPTTWQQKNFIIAALSYDKPKRCSVKAGKECLNELLPDIKEHGISVLMVCDAAYFTFLTGLKAEKYYGYVCDCTFKGYEHFKIIPCPNYQAAVYNPTLLKKIELCTAAFNDYMGNVYEPPGKDIIHFAEYPNTVEDTRKWLIKLLEYAALTVDIEAASLEFWNAGISTITFCWDKHEGIAFGVDRYFDDYANEFAYRPSHAKAQLRSLLKQFFENYKGKIILHNAGYDLKVLVYELWMNSLDDYPNMIEGIKCLTKNFDDTKLILYLATNNAVQNDLALKAAAAPYTGEYAENVTDTSKIPLSDLLKYNLKDGLATWYVKEKYTSIMIQDQQEQFYKEHFLPSVKYIIQLELCGMPIDPTMVQKAKIELTGIVTECVKYFQNSEVIKDFNTARLTKKAAKKTEEARLKAKTDRKTKVYKITDSVIAEDFNPGSGTQIGELLYEYMKYPIIAYTKTKQPATGAKVIKRLLNHTNKAEYVEIIERLLQYSSANKILSTFIPPFENAQQLPDGTYRLYGNVNVGGTQSLRVSSSNPNLTNIPSGSTFGKLIKRCFISPKGKLFVGSDFDALTI